MCRQMNTNLLCFLLLCCCWTIGCSRMSYGDKILANTKKIRLGMEKTEVTDSLGPPFNSFPDQTDFHRETLYYYIPRRHTDDPDRRPLFFVGLNSNRVCYTSCVW